MQKQSLISESFRYKDPSFRSPIFCFVLSRFLRKISTLITMELHNAKVVCDASVSLMLSNGAQGKFALASLRQVFLQNVLYRSRFRAYAQRKKIFSFENVTDDTPYSAQWSNTARNVAGINYIQTTEAIPVVLIPIDPASRAHLASEKRI